MGDRCSLTMTCLKKDIPAFDAILGDGWRVQVDEETEHRLTVSIEEANYSLYSERLALAKQKLCFLGSHSAGYEYAAMFFASFNGKYADIEAIDGQPVVRVEKDGKVGKRSLRDLNRFLKIDQQARQALQLEKT